MKLKLSFKMTSKWKQKTKEKVITVTPSTWQHKNKEIRSKKTSTLSNETFSSCLSGVCHLWAQCLYLIEPFYKTKAEKTSHKPKKGSQPWQLQVHFLRLYIKGISYSSGKKAHRWEIGAWFIVWCGCSF